MKNSDQIKNINAVVLYILEHFKEDVDYIKLFKIMYFAQRKSLVTYGQPAVDDTFKVGFKGPVPVLTNKVFKNIEDGIKVDRDLSAIAKSISVKNQKVTGNKKANKYYLSVANIKCLDWAIAEYKDMSSEELSKLSHDKVYNDVAQRATEDPQKDVFTNIDIARSGGATEEMLDFIRERECIKILLS